MATKTPNLEQRVDALEAQIERVDKLEGQMADVLAKPAYKRKTDRGVCAKGHADSAKCPDASLGRMQGGCHGWACLAEGQAYYQAYRARKKAEGAAVPGTPVPTPRKRSTAPTATSPKKSGTIKRATAKKAATPTAPVKRIKRRGQ